MRTSVLLFGLCLLAQGGAAACRPLAMQTKNQFSSQVIGQSVEGVPIEAKILGRGSHTILYIGGIHGSEPAGGPLLDELETHLRAHPRLLRGRKAVLVARANPDGLARKRRGNANGVDLNRNFPSSNRRNRKRFGMSALSEPEALALYQTLWRYRPAHIISIHQPLAVIDYDGPAESLAQQMAEHCDLPVKQLGARPGSLGSCAGVVLDIPIITLELKEGDHRLAADELWRRYGPALLAALQHKP